MTGGLSMPPAERGSRQTGSWWRVLLIALLFYIIGLAILNLTGSLILFPTVLLLGSFTVPAAYVAFFYERRYLSSCSMPTTVLSFLYGGFLGIFAASLLEGLFISRLDFLTAFEVGLIEEFAKIMGVLVIARRRHHDSELDGLILGAGAGMGFAALESLGYAFSAVLSSNGSLSAAVTVSLLRGLLSPSGHGIWTAILASVLFRESVAGRFRLNSKVIGAYLTVVILHGLWDGLPNLMMTFIPSVHAVFIIGQVSVGAIGIFIVWRRWLEAERLQMTQVLAAAEAT